MYTRTVPFLLALAPVLVGQAPIDLLDTYFPPGIALCGPRLEAARVVVLRGDDEARAFAITAFGEDKKELHIDFAKEQIVALCWGTRRIALELLHRGGLPQMPIDRAVIADQTLQITLRTLLPVGKRAEDPEGCATYPSIFLHTPITKRVCVEVGGTRCREQRTDFQPIRDGSLEVAVLPDSMPSRAEVELAPENVSRNPAPRVELKPVAHGQRLVIDWGEHPPACYALDVVELRIQDGVAHIAARAHVFAPMFYQGPPVLRPRLVLDLPPVRRVLLRIERQGSLTEGDTHDFAPSTGEELSVEVDRSAAAREMHCLVR
jgi:hypothetical protein